MVRKITLVVLLFFLFILPQGILAAEKPTTTNKPLLNEVAKASFSTSYDVSYDVDDSGVTTVTENIILKNLTSDAYANKFNLTIGATEIYDPKASDRSGPLTVLSEHKDNTTSVSVQFTQQVAGLGKTLPWTLSFKTKDFVEKAGKVWEIRTPRVSATSSLESYNLTLSVPQAFGELSAVSPTPRSQTISGGKIFLTFDLNQLKNTGISASFGTSQLFDFDLTYHLENDNLVPILTNIALPPDTAYQDVIYQRIDPQPLNITVDSDGNYLAWYRLNHNEKLDIKAVGSAKLYANSKVKQPYLDDTLKQEYTKSQKYWEKDNPVIINKLAEILGDNPPADTESKAKLIFQSVVSDLKYNADRLKDASGRMGAVTALNNPDVAVCTEFTDLFIALMRQAGIPARELDGYAYTANTTLRPLSLTKDVLHAWPEYWDDKKGWVMVDPTWENTTRGVDYFSKLDLNHFVFVIRGTSSEEPIPAGTYKYANQNTHDVKVALSENDFLGHPQLNVTMETGSPIWAGFPNKLKLKITNIGNAVYPSSPLTISTNQLTILNAGNQVSGVIPAFGKANFEFKTRTKSLFDSYNDQITLSIGGQKFTKDVTIKPFILLQNVPLTLGGIIAVILVIYLVVLVGHIYRRKILYKKLVKK